MGAGSGTILLGLVIGSGPLATQPTMILGPAEGHAGGRADHLQASLIDGQGRLVAAGWSRSPNGAVRGLVLRWTAEGQLDPSFGDAGVVLVDDLPRATHARIFALAEASTGLVFAGDRGDGRTHVGWFGGLTESGALDVQLGRAFEESVGEQPLVGAAWFRSRPLETFRSLARDGEGRVLVAGTSSEVRFGWLGPKRVSRGLVFRVRPDGRFDREFGHDGRAFIGGRAPLSVRNRDEVLRVRVDRDQLMLVGWLEGPLSNEERGFVARFDLDGRPLATSSPTGVWQGSARSTAGGRKEVFYDLLAMDDRHMVFGFSFTEDEKEIAPMVLTLSGSNSDQTAVSVHHRFMLPPSMLSTHMALGIRIAPDRDGRLLLLGYTQDAGDHARAGDRGFLATASSTGAVTELYTTDGATLPAVELHDLATTANEIIAVGSTQGRALVLRWSRNEAPAPPPPVEPAPGE